MKSNVLVRAAVRRVLPGACAALLAAPAGASAPPTVSLDDLAPGTAAVARTVFRGTDVGRFDVEIVSVVRGIGPDQDLILARAVGDEITRLGVAQGMSGSPVYVGDRLIGAVSSTWSFLKEPLFGITPAGQMAREAEHGFRREGSSSPPSRSGDLLLHDRAPPAPSAPGFRAIGSPLVLSGFDRRLVDLAAEEFAPWGFTVTEGGAGGAAPGGAIEPGAMIGVRLAGGDVDMTAFGTVTWVDGDRVYAWGHPLFQMGDVEMPLVDGFVHATVPSNALSFKLASGGDVVGTCTGDRRSGVFGRLGRTPRLLDFELTVQVGDESERFRFDLVRNRFLAPRLVGLTAANAVLSRLGLQGERTVSFTQRIVLEDGRDTEVKTLISGDETLQQITSLLSQATRVIATNPFEDVEIARVEATLAYEPGVRLGALTELAVDDDTVEPGGVFRGTYVIRDFRGDERRHRFAVPVPDDAPEGPYLLLAADAMTAEQYEAERSPRSFEPRTLDEYLERLRRLRQTDEVHLHLYRRSDGVLIDGKPLADLPPSVLSVLRGAARSGIEENLPAELVYEETIAAGRYIVGGHDLLLRVRKEKP